jgi:LPXTG-motif cell wall-anchored protein
VPEPTTTTTTVPEPTTTTTTVPEPTTTTTTTTVPEPTTTTTVPAPSTTVPTGTTTTTVVTARVLGVVWLDANRNGIQDAGEPGLPRTTVRLEQNVVGASSVRTASVRVASAVLETVTDAAGRYVFESVQPGSWSVRATLSSPALSQVYDSSGNVDWVVPVSVPVNGEARGDFAAAGTAKLVGTLTTTSGARVMDGTATVRWAGPDGVLGNDDDVAFDVTITDGSFSIEGIPAGAYSITGAASDGREAAGDRVTVSSGTNRAELVVPEELPETGSDSRTFALLGVVLLLAGVAVRRRPAR